MLHKANLPDLSRAKGGHVLGDMGEEPSFTHFHFSWCLMWNTSTQAAATVSHITPDSYHTSSASPSLIW